MGTGTPSPLTVAERDFAAWTGLQPTDGVFEVPPSGTMRGFTIRLTEGLAVPAAGAPADVFVFTRPGSSPTRFMGYMYLNDLGKFGQRVPYRYLQPMDRLANRVGIPARPCGCGRPFVPWRHDWTTCLRCVAKGEGRPPVNPGTALGAVPRPFRRNGPVQVLTMDKADKDKPIG